MRGGRALLVAAITFLLGFVAAYFVFTPSELPVAQHLAEQHDPPKPKSPPPDDDAQNSWPDDGDSPEQVFYAQAERMQDAIGKLTPRVADRVNMYVIAFAGVG